MKCSNDHQFMYPSYDRDSDSLVCPTCRHPVEMTEPLKSIRQTGLASQNPLEEEVKDLQELVKTLSLRVERLEKQVDISQKSSRISLFRKIWTFFRL